MNSIFKYINYRAYLEEYYREKKKATRYFSYRYFAEKAGFKSPVFLKQVINGDRNLTRPMIEKFSKALDLNKKENRFFKNLVLFNQAKTSNEKQEHYSVMSSMNDYVKQHQLTNDKYAYFDNWYNTVIRELVCLHDFKNDYELLAQSLNPPITAKEARQSVELLLRLKLLVKSSKGIYKRAHMSLTSGLDVLSMVRRGYNSKMLELSQQANDELSPQIRNVSNITMGISRDTFEVLRTEIAAFQERVVSIVNKDERSSQVYQFCLSLVPLSRDTEDLSKDLLKNRVKGGGK